tara:strand:- start:189 stop:461 length:273 start_codon:yes stop_codon:yes gene_type:complete
MKQCHNIIIPKDKNVFAYSVNISNNICPRITNNQKERIEFYKENKVIPKDMKKISNIISFEKMYFDVNMGFITIHPYTKQEVLDVYKSKQ